MFFLEKLDMTFLNFKELSGLWDVAKHQDKKEFDAAEDEDKVIIFLDKLSERPLLAAYTYQRGAVPILDVIEAELKKPPTAVIKRHVKLWAARKARESAKEYLQFPKVKN